MKKEFLLYLVVIVILSGGCSEHNGNKKLPDSLIIDGKDISPLLRGEKELNRKDLFWHFPHYWWGQNVRPYSIVRSGDWKLIKHWEGGEELYNLKDDISETNNLSETNPKKRKELENKLAYWLKETSAKLPVPNPGYVRKDE